MTTHTLPSDAAICEEAVPQLYRGSDLTEWFKNTLKAYENASRPIESDQDQRILHLDPRQRERILFWDDPRTRGETYWAEVVHEGIASAPIEIPSWASEARQSAGANDDGVVTVQFCREADLGAASVVIDQFVNLHLAEGIAEQHPVGIILRATDRSGRTTAVELEETAITLIISGLEETRRVLAEQWNTGGKITDHVDVG